MWDQITEMMRSATLKMAQNIAELLPGIVGLLLIVAGAILIAVLLRGLVLRALRGLQFDQRAEHLGFGSTDDWGPMGGLSLIVARVVMWTVIVVGILTGLSALDPVMASAFAQSTLAYLPNLFAALLIVVVGVVFARFLARAVLIGAVNLHLGAARLLSTAAKWLLLLLAWTLALEHLGIGRGLLSLAFLILFGGIVLAASLAVGLGSKDAVRRNLERQREAARESQDQMTHF
jgi:hypothetical protein